MIQEERFVFIDCETTGLSPQAGHRVIELGCVEYIGSAPTGNCLNTILSADGRASTVEALLVHGISNQSRKDKPDFASISQQFLTLVKDAHVVIYNSPFDISFIENEFSLIHQPIKLTSLCAKVTCAMLLAQQKLNLKRVSLDSACKRYHIDISHRKIHSALKDAELTASLYFAMMHDDIQPLKRLAQKDSINPKIEKLIQIPRSFKHPDSGDFVQLNYCRNPMCKNYGVIPKNPKRITKGKNHQTLENDYRVIFDQSGDLLIKCKLCNQSTFLINNKAFVQESLRIQSLGKQDEPSCTNEQCENHSKGLYQNPQLYRKHGTVNPQDFVSDSYITKGDNNGKPLSIIKFESRIGSRRYLCKKCGTTFTVKRDAQSRHYRRDLNEQIFLALMNKGVYNRIVDIFQINFQTLYNKIDFFYKQCLLFDKYHLIQLQNSLASKQLIFSTDRQMYLSNWTSKVKNYPTQIINTSTVENNTGFVLASTINFDGFSDYEYIKKEYHRKKEGQNPRCYRRFAQYVIEDSDNDLRDASLPIPLLPASKGLLVHQTYNILAHFDHVKSLIQHMECPIFFLDNDSGFQLSFNSVFQNRISKNNILGFILASEGISKKEKILEPSAEDLLRNIVEEQQKLFPEESPDKIRRRTWAKYLDKFNKSENSKPEWIPNPNAKSRFLAAIPLTPCNKDQIEFVSYLLHDCASLNGVDNWFQILRRCLNPLERPITSATNGHRWNAYAGYNPIWITKLIEIMRVYRNYCVTDEKYIKRNKIDREPTTPACKIGIAERTYSVSDILSFNIS